MRLQKHWSIPVAAVLSSCPGGGGCLVVYEGLKHPEQYQLSRESWGDSISIAFTVNLETVRRPLQCYSEKKGGGHLPNT